MEPQNADEWIVYTIRLLWAGDSNMRRTGYQVVSFDYPFGSGDFTLPREEVDANLLASFNAEREHHDDDLSTIWTLIRG